MPDGLSDRHPHRIRTILAPLPFDANDMPSSGDPVAYQRRPSHTHIIDIHVSKIAQHVHRDVTILRLRRRSRRRCLRPLSLIPAVRSSKLKPDFCETVSHSRVPSRSGGGNAVPSLSRGNAVPNLR